MQFTDLAVRTLPPGTYWDAHTRGLGLRVGKQSRTFIVLVRSGTRKTLGRYPYLTLKTARAECARIKAEAVLGRLDPKRIAFQDAVSEYLADCADRVRPRSLKNYRDYLAFFKYGRRSLSDITARDIIATLKPLSQSQREHANRVFKTFLTWCVRHSLLDHAPNMPPVALGKPRQRVLDEDELRAVYKAARAGTTPFHAIVALLVLTGQRRGEIARLEWDWIDQEKMCITFPAHATKNGRIHSIPYGQSVAQLLEGLPRFSHGQLLFPAARIRSRDTTTFNGFSKSKADFDATCGVYGWTLHDLRRTFATNLQRLGVRLEVTEALLNHVSGSRRGVVGIYQRYQWLPEAREAVLTFERWLSST